MSKLTAKAMYQASYMPIEVRLTTPDGSWAGAQWKANNFAPDEIQRRHLRCPAACKPPYFGWLGLAQGSPAAPPRGLIVIMSAFDRTPSVAATVNSLRTRGKGAVYEPTTHVTLAGIPALQFDGHIVGPSHVFIPFSPPTTKATAFADAIEIERTGDAFRFIIVNVRGKTVVVFIDSAALPAEQFADFLTRAEPLLESLTFPA